MLDKALRNHVALEARSREVEPLVQAREITSARRVWHVIRIRLRGVVAYSLVVER